MANKTYVDSTVYQSRAPAGLGELIAKSSGILFKPPLRKMKPPELRMEHITVKVEITNTQNSSLLHYFTTFDHEFVYN